MRLFGDHIDIWFLLNSVSLNSKYLQNLLFYSVKGYWTTEEIQWHKARLCFDCVNLKNYKPRYKSRQPKCNASVLLNLQCKYKTHTEAHSFLHIEDALWLQQGCVQYVIVFLAISLRTLNRLRKNSSNLVTYIHTPLWALLLSMTMDSSWLSLRTFEAFWTKDFYSDFKWVRWLTPYQLFGIQDSTWPLK